jgi:hypothetical protein
MGVVSTGQITLYDANEVPVATLTNEVHAVPCNADGSNPNLSGAVTTLTVLLGGTDITSLYTVTATPSSGITGNLSGTTYTVTGMTVDVGYVDFTATRSGWPTLTKRFSLAKQKQGSPGPQGPQGPTGPTGLTPWFAYHDNPVTIAPATPTGSGTTNGWHSDMTSTSVWVSVKQAASRDDTGTWSTPAVLPGIGLLPTYTPKYLGVGKLSSTTNATFRLDSISANGVITIGANITANPGDWMYNYDTSLVQTLSVFRWSGSAWETTSTTWEHWIAASEDIGRYIKAAPDKATRDARTPAAWTFLDTLFASEAFLDRLAARLIRSANYQAGVAGMSIDLNNATIKAENGKWVIDGTTGKITAYDFTAYNLDFMIVDCGDYKATLPEDQFGSDGLLDFGTYVVATPVSLPDLVNDCGSYLGG